MNSYKKAQNTNSVSLGPKIQNLKFKTFVLVRACSWSKFFYAFLFLFIPVTAYAAEEMPNGQIIPKVVSKANPQHSYALYLPSDYTPEKKWPIIYAFEPAARGPVPVERFKEAAEKFGYIIAASNNSRNGMSGNEINPIINNLLDDTGKRLATDPNRVYLAGFSGGARLALRLAVAGKGAFAGVIICGAGFPQGLQPTKDLPFVIFGTAGREDFNYPEMISLDETLSRLNLPHRFVVFDGAHDWANTELCVKAIEWLEIQAMRANLKAKDETWIEKLWIEEAEQAHKYETNGKLYEAYLAYDALKQDFKGLRRNTIEEEKKVAELKENKIVKQTLKDLKDEIGKQQILANQLISFGQKAANADSSERAFVMQELRSLASEVRKKTQEAEDTSQRRIARRSLRQASAYFYETSLHQLIPQKKYDAATLYIEILIEINPKNSFAFVELARAYAVAKQKKQAFQALQKAIERGFNDATTLEDKDFDFLRGDSDWQKLIESIKRKKLTKEYRQEANQRQNYQNKNGYNH